MKRVLFLFFASLLPLVTWAYDFSDDSTGVTIYYNLISSEDKTVEIHQVNRYWGASDYTGDFVIPESVTHEGVTYTVIGIGSSAFTESTVTSVYIPNSITYIDTYAFELCSKLTELDIPNSVTSIGRSAFDYCSVLVKVTLPDNLTIIEDNTFYNCWVLSSITLPSTITSIGGSAFDGCACLEDIEIPNGVASLGNAAFQNCASLKEMTIPESISSIPGSLFSGCTGLEKVTLHDAITSIGGSAFNSCSSLKEITLPKEITSIGNYTFEGCNSLTEITIPEAVVSIDQGAFNGCTNLKTVNYNATACTTVNNGSYPPFLKCSALTEVNIGENVTLIPNHIFSGLTGLTSVTIPASVTSIATNAFGGSDKAGYTSNLTSVTALPTTPPECASDAFLEDYAIALGTLYVPCGSEDAYSEADTWGDFSTIVGIDCEPTTFDYTLDPAEGEVSYLHSIGLTYEDGVQLNAKESKWGNAKVYDANGDEVVEVIIATPIGTYGQTYTGYSFTLGLDGSSQDVTEAGDYYFVIPEGYLSFYDSTNDEWVECEQIIAHYVIEGEGDTGTFVCDVDPADGAKVTKLDQIIFTNPSGGEIFVNEEIRDLEINIYDEGGDLITQVTNFYTDFGDNWEEWVQIAMFGGSDDDGNVYPSEITAEGTYYVSVPANVFFVYDEGGNVCYNESMSLTYIVSADAGTENPDYTLSFSPEDGSTLDVLSTITISCEDGITQVLMPDEEITITDAENNTWSGNYTITEVANDLGIVTEVVISLSPEIAEAGTYYVNVPSGYFDINQRMNEAFTLTYTITGTYAGISGISINDENVEGIYSVGGQKLNTTVKGVNIIRFSDGSVKKLYVK